MTTDRAVGVGVITPEQLTAWERAYGAATPGLWKGGRDDDGKPIALYCPSGYEVPETVSDEMLQGAKNLDFVESARMAMPVLFAEVRRLAEENAIDEVLSMAAPEGYRLAYKSSRTIRVRTSLGTYDNWEIYRDRHEAAMRAETLQEAYRLGWSHAMDMVGQAKRSKKS